jgi:protein ImuB
VLLDKQKSALRLSAVNPAALAAGLAPSMTWADAQAQCPEVEARPHDVGADATWEGRVLQAFGRFSPIAAMDPPYGLMLDVTGCTHLFGGEAGVVRSAQRLARQLGLQVRLALARTPQAARAYARFGPGGIIPSGEEAAALRRLPITALELSPADAVALRRAGLHTLAAVDDRPRQALAARFGQDFPSRLDRILGREDTRITPVRPSTPIRADRVLLEPIQDEAAVLAVLSDLLHDVERQLRTRSQGARGFALSLFRVDGHVRRIGVGTARAERDPGLVHRLFRERLGALDNPIDPGFGFDLLRLEAERLETVAPAQISFDAAPRQDVLRDALVDRLTAGLGPAAVLRIHSADSHLPERATALSPAISAANERLPWPDVDDGSPPLRPLQLFDPPQPIETLAELPDSPPRRFRWRRVMHEVVRAEGPERIEGEWWRRGGGRVRDYYRVEDAHGRRFWLFRAGHYGQEPGARWYVHGLFA